jgi:arginase
MKVDLIAVPYHLGRARVGMGLGPLQLLEQGAATRLSQAGHEVEISTIDLESPFRHETQASFELNRLLAARVRQAAERGCFPLVLSGNCNSALGTLSGLGAERRGVVWFDAHGEFNTPDTTRSGFLDGMPLTMATGRTWKTLCQSVPGFRPLPDEDIVLIGSRALDPGETELLEQSGVRRVATEAIRRAGVREALAPHLETLARRVKEIYIHLDLDVLDPEEAQVNEYAEPGGLTTAEVEEACRLAASRFSLGAAAVASYDPEWDERGRGARAALRLIESLLPRLA